LYALTVAEERAMVARYGSIERWSARETLKYMSGLESEQDRQQQLEHQRQLALVAAATEKRLCIEAERRKAQQMEEEKAQLRAEETERQLQLELELERRQLDWGGQDRGIGVDWEVEVRGSISENWRPAIGVWLYEWAAKLRVQLEIGSSGGGERVDIVDTVVALDRSFVRLLCCGNDFGSIEFHAYDRTMAVLGVDSEKDKETKEEVVVVEVVKEVLEEEEEEVVVEEVLEEESQQEQPKIALGFLKAITLNAVEGRPQEQPQEQPLQQQQCAQGAEDELQLAGQEVDAAHFMAAQLIQALVRSFLQKRKLAAWVREAAIKGCLDDGKTAVVMGQAKKTETSEQQQVGPSQQGNEEKPKTALGFLKGISLQAVEGHRQ
jgi:hypothetical protein